MQKRFLGPIPLCGITGPRNDSPGEEWFRNRIVAAAPREGVTPQQALQSQPDAAAEAVPLDGFVGVVRAGGVIPAGRPHERRKTCLITANRRE